MLTSHKLGKRQGFTLLELLVVVAILAIIAGGLIVAYDGLEAQSSKGSAAHGIAGVDQAVRAYTTVARTSPNNLDGLVDTAGALALHLPDKLAGKITPVALTAEQANALIAAGITHVRQLDSTRNVQDGDDLNDITLADIPNRAYDDPTLNKNRGRGVETLIADGITVPVWIAGTDPVGVNNTKLGALPDDVLVAFGLGNNSTLIGNSLAPTVAGRPSVANVTLSAAPTYGNVQKHEYSRYILLYNVGTLTQPRSTAKLQAVVDTRGDFLDEEMAEYTGQKP